jgi:dipeptidyl aminopeptidase/acylaminoacyl peptidase
MKKTLRHFALASSLLILSSASLPGFAEEAVKSTAPSDNTQREPNVLQPGTNLVLQHIPKPPLSLVDDVNRYTEFRRAVLADWHPTKHQMLIETRFGDTTQVHQVTMPGGDRSQVTFFRDTVHGATYPSESSDYFVFTKDKGGDEFFQKYAYSVGNKKVTLLTDGKSRNTGGVWSNRGNRYAYGSTRRNEKDVDVYLLDATNPSSDRLLCKLDGGGWAALDWAPDDRSLVVQEEISVNESRLWKVDTESGEKTIIAPKDTSKETTKNLSEKVYYGDARFARDGKGIYAISDKGSEFKKLIYIDMTDGSETCLSQFIPWDILQMEISRDGSKLAFIANEDGTCTLHIIELATKKEVQLPNFPQGQVSGICWHNNNRDLAFNLENARTPSDVYSVNTADGAVERWTHSETGMADLNTASEGQLFHFKSFDGRQISAFLYKPKSTFSGKRPVIINIHGGPESQWRPRFLGATNYLLNELGIAVIYPNVRGSTGYGKTFSQLDNGLLRSDSYKDIGALLDWVKSNPTLDADRIMITGGSYGGNMTLSSAVLYSDKIRCSLEAFGPSNFVSFLKNTKSYRQDLRRVEYGDERQPEVAAFLEKIAPFNHADAIKKPLFVVQGDNDPRVPVSESDQMVKAVRATGTPVWYLRARDEGHGFSKKINTDFLFFTTVEFIKQYLLD